MAWHNELHQEKDHTGDIQVGHSKNRVLNVGSSRDKVDELWSILRYDALLNDSVDNDLKSRGVRTKAKKDYIKSELSSYIDQAENFYRYARNSDYRSAALLYYYSFLNLGKAYVVLNRPDLVDKKFRHGIARKNTRGKLIDRSLTIQGSRGGNVSVFNEIYNLQYGTYLPDRRAVSFEHVLGYVTDVSDEATKLLGRPAKKIHNAKLYVFLNKSSKKCWTVIATDNGFYPANYKMAFNDFAQNFQRFNPGPITLEYVFRMNRNEANGYNFSQSIAEYDQLPSGSVPLWETKQHIDDTIGKFCQDYVYDHEISFSITDPLRKNWQIPFNEPLSIYMMMFYLSEVVRYNPGEFNHNFAPDTKEGWLIKNFIESSPYACLVYLVSKITNRTYIINPR